MHTVASIQVKGGLVKEAISVIGIKVEILYAEKYLLGEQYRYTLMAYQSVVEVKSLLIICRY